ncbi:zinc ABC transporter substrate-binding protein [Paracoccus sp. MBLB3053]|uniref:High-affinity zinc uptake system protein ZnuA n=1 Tax=Paracoccus aurantius TaxID=3073814 RepID=A0ABU2HMR5_9RHOB|nr:zinc ABC transporter substrate-binding protein [Paracoccus sp. MBLB3053]MDS9466052.1 zinc ABC transporter substrate-binding protein [Paracoccus sp. MBLB3053]
MRQHFRLAPAFAVILGSGALPALADPPRVVSDIPVVGAMVQEVMGDLGEPTVLLETGGDAHHYQLRPSQARSLQDAELLVWVGPELTPWLARPAESLSQGRSLGLLALPETHRRDYGSAEAHEGHDHEDHGHDHDHAGHDHDAHDHGEGDGHDHSGVDPHAWLDPENGRLWLGAIAASLSELDPENASTYSANAKAAAEEIAAQDQTLRATLETVKGKSFVVFHDAYGYFTEHYGLMPAIPVSLGDAAAPSAARLREIQQQVQHENATCAFPEANHDPKLLTAVLEGSDVRQGNALDPEGSLATSGKGLYSAILSNLGSALADCLSRP